MIDHVGDGWFIWLRDLDLDLECFLPAHEVPAAASGRRPEPNSPAIRLEIGDPVRVGITTIRHQPLLSVASLVAVRERLEPLGAPPDQSPSGVTLETLQANSPEWRAFMRELRAGTRYLDGKRIYLLDDGLGLLQGMQGLGEALGAQVTFFHIGQARNDRTNVSNIKRFSRYDNFGQSKPDRVWELHGAEPCDEMAVRMQEGDPQPDLILIDYSLHQTDAGLTLAHYFHAMDPTIPVALMTGDPQGDLQQDRARAALFRAKSFLRGGLRKPIDDFQVIRRLLDGEQIRELDRPAHAPRETLHDRELGAGLTAPRPGATHPTEDGVGLPVGAGVGRGGAAGTAVAAGGGPGRLIP